MFNPWTLTFLDQRWTWEYRCNKLARPSALMAEDADYHVSAYHAAHGNLRTYSRKEG